MKNLAKFQAYMAGFEGMQADSAKLVPLLAQAMNMTPAQVQQMMAENLPAMAAMLQNMPQMQRDFNGLISTMQANEDIFSQVPAGLAPYQPARPPMQANVDNAADVNSLPSFHALHVVLRDPGRAPDRDRGLRTLDESRGGDSRRAPRLAHAGLSAVRRTSR